MANPPQVDPQSVLSGQFNVLPPTNPVQPQQAGSTIDPMQQSLLGASQLGQETFKGQLGRMHDISDQLAQARAQQAALYQPGAIPKMGFTPSMQPVTGGKSLFHDIGQALLTGLAATRPGQNVEREIYKPGVQKWQAQTQGKAEQIRELQEQMGAEEKPLEAATNMGIRPYMAIGSAERGQAALMNAQTQAKWRQVQGQLDAARNQIMLDLGNKKITNEQANIRMKQTVEGMRDQTLRDVAGMTTDQRDRDTQIGIVNSEFDRLLEHPLTYGIEQALGVNQRPSETPTAPPGPKAKGSAVNKPQASAAPARPQGVPSNAVWNPNTRTWQIKGK